MPLTIIFGFLVLAAVAGFADRSNPQWLQQAQQLLSVVVLPQQNQSMLRTIAPGMLTLMTITFLLLLTLVNQMAAVFTWVVVEHFLLRRDNQVFFGYFTGLSTYLVIVVAVADPKQAVFSTSVALVLCIFALAGLVVFGYLVLDQLRPPSVVERIVERTLITRTEQETWLRHVRDEPLLATLPETIVRAESTGYLVEIDLAAISRAVGPAANSAEIEFHTSLGNHIVIGATIASVRADSGTERKRLVDVVLDALRVGRERQHEREPAYGVHQLSSIGWAAATQQDPEAALVAVDGLHTLLAHWTHDRIPASSPDDKDSLPVVYRDTTISEALSALASIAVGAKHGGQHQTCAQVLRVFASVLPQLPPENQHFAVEQAQCALPARLDYPATADLDRARTALATALSDTGHSSLVAQLRGEARLDP